MAANALFCLQCLRRTKQLLFLILLLLTHFRCEGARISALVTSPPVSLSYHNGPLLTGSAPLRLYFLWYGTYSPAQKSVLTDFATSFSSPSPSASGSMSSLASWWSITSSYRDGSNSAVTSSISLASQVSLPSPNPATVLKRADLLSLLLSSLSSHSLPVDPHGIYFIFTADNVPVEKFCMNSCGFHDYTPASPATGNLRLPFAWVGNSASQCPGYCAWPFAQPQFGPQTPPLVSPNSDVGIDGMIINAATLLAGIVTNPFDTGYYQGDPLAPLEAVSACTGIFGKGAYPGYPGQLFTDQKTGASFNAHGINGRTFLLPAIWSPKTMTCTPLS